MLALRQPYAFNLNGTMPLCCALRTKGTGRETPYTLQSTQLVPDSTACSMCPSVFENLPPSCVGRRCSRRSVGAGDVLCTGSTVPCSNVGRARAFSLLQNVLTGCRTHTASCLMATGVKRPGREAGYLTASRSEIRVSGVYICALFMPSWRGQ